MYFDRETVDMLRTTLDRASVPPSRRAGMSRSVLAERILKAAAHGERDPDRLRARALKDDRSTMKAASCRRLRLLHRESEVKSKRRWRAKVANLSTHFCPGGRLTGGWYRVEGVSAMMDVLDLPAKVVSGRDEARECLRLAKAEPPGEVRTVLMGMALGWLKLADHTKPPQAPQIERADLNG
jgi:hypothetical protein